MKSFTFSKAALVATLAAASAFSTYAIAEPGDVHLVIHGFSKHSHARSGGRSWNETNLGAGLRYDATEDVSVESGFYINSVDRNSIYLLADYMPIHVGKLSAGVFAGLVSGYEKSVRPGAGAIVRWQEDRVSLIVRAIPKVDQTKTASVSASVAIRFDEMKSGLFAKAL